MDKLNQENYLQKDIKECLGELREREREIILLYYWWGYNDSEIGKILGESQQTINYQRNRILKKIRDMLLYK